MALSQSAVSELLEAFRAGEGVDLIRESVRMVMQELIEAEATEQIGAGRYERTEARTTERNGSRPQAAGHPGRRRGAADPEAAQGVVLPGHPRAAAADRPGAVCGGDGGLRARGLHPRGRRPGRRAGDRLRDLQVRGVADLRRPGRGGRPRSASRALDHTAFPYVYLDATYLHVRNATSQVVVDGGGGGDRDHRRRRPGGPRPRRRRQRGRGVLARRSWPR